MDRCERIAELLLKENELNKLESVSSFIGFYDILACFDYYAASETPLTPIEKIMYAILQRITDDFNHSFRNKLEMNFAAQQRIGKYRVDFTISTNFSDTVVVIECDGHDFHEKTKEQAKRDKERDRYLTSQGYKILRYTGSEIYNDFAGIEKELSRLLDAPCSSSLFSEREK